MFTLQDRRVPVPRRAGGLAVSLVVHALLAAALVVEWPRIRSLTARDAGAREPVVELVPPSAVAEALPGDASLSQEVPADTAPPVDVDGFTFDIASIRARRNELFTFLTSDLLFLDRLDQQVRAPGRRLINPFSAGDRSTARPAFVARDDDIRAIVDRAWSRRDRWKSFQEIAALLRHHDPDGGRLPALLQHYLEANILQPYYPGPTKDPRLWTMLGLAADHADFIDLTRAFARAHPSSRATIELLFLLDELAQGSRDALLILVNTNPASELERTRLADREAYELAAGIWRYYRAWLAERDLDSVAAINAAYDRIRVKLLATILALTPGGYRAADARYLLGEIYFYRGMTADAHRWWRGMTPSPRDTYYTPAIEVLDQLTSPGGLGAADTHVILAGARQVWLDFSRERLRRFGYAFDTF
jgi:hypothetical protein